MNWEQLTQPQIAEDMQRVSKTYMSHDASKVLKQSEIQQRLEAEAASKKKKKQRSQAASSTANAPTTQLALPARLIFIPKIEVDLEFEKVAGFPEGYDVAAMCIHIRESDCHYRVKKPTNTEDIDEYALSIQNEMYKLMKDECYTDFRCGAECLDGKVSDDPNGFNINGISLQSNTANHLPDSNGDANDDNNENANDDTNDDAEEDALVAITAYVILSMIRNKKNIIFKNGSVYHPLCDKRRNYVRTIRTETLLSLESQFQNKSRHYLCMLCSCKSKTFHSAKPESVRKHLFTCHGRTSEIDSTFLDSHLSAVLSYCVENDCPLSFAENNKHTCEMLLGNNIDPSSMHSSKVREILIKLTNFHKDILKSFVTDPDYKIPTLNSTDPDYYERILEETAKCHTFFSATEDGITIKNESYESLYIHLNCYYKWDLERLDIEGDLSSYFLSVDRVNSTDANALYEHTKKVLKDKVGNINPLSCITTDGASNVAGMRSLFSEKDKVLSLRCYAHLIQLFYASLLKLLVGTKFVRPLHKNDKFYTLVCQVNEPLSECLAFLDKNSEKALTITTTKKLQREMKKSEEREDLTVPCQSNEEVKQRASVNPQRTPNPLPTEDNNDDDDDNDDNDDTVEEQPEPAALDDAENTTTFKGFTPTIAIDFESVEFRDDLMDITSDEYIIEVYRRAEENPEMEDLIKRLDDCCFDPHHENFANALKFLKSAKYGISDIQQLNSKLRSYMTSITPTIRNKLGLRSMPTKYIEVRWVSLKSFYQPYITDECRPVKFKELDESLPVKKQLKVMCWLTYQDLIYMRVMMGYMDELSHLTHAVSDEDFSVLSMEMAATTAYQCSSSLLFNFLQMDIIDEQFYSKTMNANVKRFSKDARGSLQDLCNLLNANVAATGVYSASTSVLVHQMIKYKFTDELYLDKDNYFTSHANQSQTHLNGNTYNYKNVKELRKNNKLDFGLNTDSRALEFFKRHTQEVDFEAHADSLSGNNHQTLSDAWSSFFGSKTTSDPSVVFEYAEDVSSPDEQLLSFIAKDVAVYSRLAIAVKHYNKRLIDKFQKKLRRVNDESFNRIYLPLRVMNIINNLTTSMFLSCGYSSPFSWVLSLVTSIKPTSVSNERGFSHLNFVNNKYRNNLNDDLFASLVHLCITSRTNKGVKHFESLYKAMAVKNDRDLLYKKDLRGSMTVATEEGDEEQDDDDDEPDADIISQPPSRSSRVRPRAQMENEA